MDVDDLLDEGSPLFRTRWLGYDRVQVDEEIARLEAQAELAWADRDAALATAEDLARHLEEARSELGEYRELHAGHSKDDAVSGCIRYLLHSARRKVEEIEAEARSRAEQAVSRAEEAADQKTRLLEEAEQETQRRLAEAGDRAREIVGEALRESRTVLAEIAQRQRLLEEWYEAVASEPNLPLPRQGEPSGARTQAGPASAATHAEPAAAHAEPAAAAHEESARTSHVETAPATHANPAPVPAPPEPLPTSPAPAPPPATDPGETTDVLSVTR
ncbi:hypothetical protein [Lentzea sp. NPDC003310]|uniref:DivIVA domain-containing protein n=1 Tax=Lentzea sp. NPDC003310 TaxID=3154447 RepID=UPI0033BC8202